MERGFSTQRINFICGFKILLPYNLICFHCFIVSIRTNSGPTQKEEEEYSHQIGAKLTQKLGYTERNTKEAKLIKIGLDHFKLK